MPKSNKHIAEAQARRLKYKEKISKYTPGRVTVQVLGTGAKGAPRSLYIFSDQSRYLFNCGEGTQRLAHEHKMKLAKLEHIFITHPVWANMGGLPGTALTIQDVGVPNITLHGPEGLDEIFKATKRFVVLRDLNIKMAECRSDVPFEDNVMIVQYVPLTRDALVEKIVSEADISKPDVNQIDEQTQTKICTVEEVSTSTRREGQVRNSRRHTPPIQMEEMDTTDYYAHERKNSSHGRKRNRSRSRSVSGNRDSSQIVQPLMTEIKELKEEGISMAYVCRLQPRPGSLNLDKCVHFGVPPGPLLGKLKSGEDITLDTGVVVKSKQVCEPDDPGPVFIVVDCPSEDYLKSLLSNKIFKRHQSGIANEEELACLVVHFTPEHVMKNPRYAEWIERFPSTTQHLVVNESNKCAGSIAVHKIQYKLNILSKQMFPLLASNDIEVMNTQQLDSSMVSDCKKIKTEPVCSVASTDSSSTTSDELQGKPFAGVSTFCSYHLRPKNGLDRSLELKLTPTEYIAETFKEKNFRQVLFELKEELKQKLNRMEIRPYPKILFLGTGSCIPNKTRNTSGILLSTSENCNIILDCGEGTYGQLVRFFGPKVDEVLANITAIYISHLHADHHIGLIGLLQGRQKALNNLKLRKNPLLLFAPKQILTWLHFYDSYFERVCQEFELIPNCLLLLNDNKIEEGVRMRILNTLDMKEINTVHVKHCPNAFGVAFTHNSQYKITYSGDTMPCHNLVELGRGSDLLIHEATMEDELAVEAVAKMHSTTSQAIDIGKQMNARYTILTHFSQRYAKIPRFNNNFADKVGDSVGIAFDNMEVRLDEISLVPLLYPAFKIMFADHYEELEHKAAKRQMKIEREREASKERQHSFKWRNKQGAKEDVVIKNLIIMLTDHVNEKARVDLPNLPYKRRMRCTETS